MLQLASEWPSFKWSNVLGTLGLCQKSWTPNKKSESVGEKEKKKLLGRFMRRLDRDTFSLGRQVKDKDGKGGSALLSTGKLSQWLANTCLRMEVSHMEKNSPVLRGTPSPCPCINLDYFHFIMILFFFCNIFISFVLWQYHTCTKRILHALIPSSLISLCHYHPSPNTSLSYVHIF